MLTRRTLMEQREDFRSAFAGWFAPRRRAWGSRSRFARAIESTETTVKNWERGTAAPDGYYLTRIAATLGEWPDELLASYTGRYPAFGTSRAA